MIISRREKILFWIIFLLILVIIVAGTWYITTGQNKSSADTKTNTTVDTKPQANTTITDTPSDTNSSNPTLTLKMGWNLVSIPYVLSPNNGKTVLSGLDTKEAYSLDSVTNTWSSLYNSGIITPGEGIWIHSETGQNYQLPGQVQPVDTSKTFTIQLKKGWNAIGNPFAQSITWNPVVKTTKGTTNFQKAVAANILSVGYASDPTSGGYITTQPNDTLKAYQGLMVKSGGDNIDLIISAN